jgi:hypothetical protein
VRELCSTTYQCHLCSTYQHRLQCVPRGPPHVPPRSHPGPTPVPTLGHHHHHSTPSGSSHRSPPPDGTRAPPVHGTLASPSGSSPISHQYTPHLTSPRLQGPHPPSHHQGPHPAHTSSPPTAHPHTHTDHTYQPTTPQDRHPHHTHKPPHYRHTLHPHHSHRVRAPTSCTPSCVPWWSCTPHVVRRSAHVRTWGTWPPGSGALRHACVRALGGTGMPCNSFEAASCAG